MSKEWWGTPPQEKSALPVSSESMFNFVSTLVLICFLLPISVSAGRQMSYQVPQKVKRQSKRHFSTARFSHPLHDSAAHRWDFCSGCALSQDCHSSIRQRRKGFELWEGLSCGAPRVHPAGCPSSPSSHQRAPLLQAAVSQPTEQCCALELEAQVTPKTGRAAGLPAEFSWKGSNCKGSERMLQVRGPLLLCRNARFS